MARQLLGASMVFTDYCMDAGILLSNICPATNYQSSQGQSRRIGRTAFGRDRDGKAHLPASEPEPTEEIGLMREAGSEAAGPAVPKSKTGPESEGPLPVDSRPGPSSGPNNLNRHRHLKTLRPRHGNTLLHGHELIHKISQKLLNETGQNEKPALLQPALILPHARQDAGLESTGNLLTLPEASAETNLTGLNEQAPGTKNPAAFSKALEKPALAKLLAAMPRAQNKPVAAAGQQTGIAEKGDGPDAAGKSDSPAMGRPENLVLQPSGSAKAAVANQVSAAIDKEPFSDGPNPTPANNEPVSITEKFIQVHQNPGAEHRSDTAEQRLSTIANKLSDRPPAVAAPQEKAELVNNGENQNPTLQGLSTQKALETVQVHLSNGKDKSPMPSASQDNAGSNLTEQLLANVQPSSTRQTSSPAPATAQGTLSTMGRADIPPSVTEQINETIRVCLQRADQEVTISLNPPYLGRVRIRFKHGAEQITGLLEVDKIQTRNEIQQAIPEIVRTLQDSGVQVKRLEVVLNENTVTNDGYGRGEPSADQRYPHKQDAAVNHDSGPTNTDVTGWQLDDRDYAEHFQTTTLIGDDSINVWV